MRPAGVTIGIPLVSAVASLRSSVLGGLHTAVLVDVGITLLAALAINQGLRKARM